MATGISVAKLTTGTDVITALTLALFAVGVALMASPPIGRLLERRRREARTASPEEDGPPPPTPRASTDTEARVDEHRPAATGARDDVARDDVARDAELQALRDKLDAKRREGLGYLRLLQPASALIAQATIGRSITSEDLAVWHTEVQLLLKPHPDLLRIYRHDPPRPLATQHAERLLSASTGGTEAERLRRSLRALRRVIDLC